MEIKLLLIDLDGTTLGKDQVEVSQANLQAIEQAQDAGVEVVLCTGRVVDMLPPMLTSNKRLRYFISSHGARVFDRDTGKTLYSNLISEEDSALVLSLIEHKNLYAEIAAEAKIYMERAVCSDLQNNNVPAHHDWYISGNKQIEVDNIAGYFAQNKICVEKVNIYNIPQVQQRDIFDQLSAVESIKFTQKCAGKDLEFYSATLDKLTAVKALCDHLNVQQKEIMAVGDSATDIDIVNFASVGVSMGNGIEELKQVANFITDTNVNDGVAKAIKMYILD